jgi:hypothetical protein
MSLESSSRLTGGASSGYEYLIKGEDPNEGLFHSWATGAYFRARNIGASEHLYPIMCFDYVLRIRCQMICAT